MKFSVLLSFAIAVLIKLSFSQENHNALRNRIRFGDISKRQSGSSLPVTVLPSSEFPLSINVSVPVWIAVPAPFPLADVQSLHRFTLAIVVDSASPDGELVRAAAVPVCPTDYNAQRCGRGSLTSIINQGFLGSLMETDGLRRGGLVELGSSLNLTIEAWEWPVTRTGENSGNSLLSSCSCSVGMPDESETVYRYWLVELSPAVRSGKKQVGDPQQQMQVRVQLFESPVASDECSLMEHDVTVLTQPQRLAPTDNYGDQLRELMQRDLASSSSSSSRDLSTERFPFVVTWPNAIEPSPSLASSGIACNCSNPLKQQCTGRFNGPARELRVDDVAPTVVPVPLFSTSRPTLLHFTAGPLFPPASVVLNVEVMDQCVDIIRSMTVTTFHDCTSGSSGYNTGGCLADYGNQQMQFPLQLDRGDTFRVWSNASLSLPSQRMAFHSENTRCCPMTPVSAASQVSVSVFAMVYVDDDLSFLPPSRNCSLSFRLSRPLSGGGPTPFDFEHRLVTTPSPSSPKVPAFDEGDVKKYVEDREPNLQLSETEPLFALIIGQVRIYPAQLLPERDGQNTGLATPVALMSHAYPFWDRTHECGPCFIGACAAAEGGADHCLCEAEPLGPLTRKMNVHVNSASSFPSCQLIWPADPMNHPGTPNGLLGSSVFPALFVFEGLISPTTSWATVTVQPPPDHGQFAVHADDSVCAYVAYDAVASVEVRNMIEMEPSVGVRPVSLRRGWRRGGTPTSADVQFDGWDAVHRFNGTGARSFHLDVGRATVKPVSVVVIVDPLCSFMGVDRATFMPRRAGILEVSDVFSVQFDFDDDSIERAEQVFYGSVGVLGFLMLLWLGRHLLVIFLGVCFRCRKERAAMRRKKSHYIFDYSDDDAIDQQTLSPAEKLFGRIRSMLLEFGRRPWLAATGEKDRDRRGTSTGDGDGEGMAEEVASGASTAYEMSSVAVEVIDFAQAGSDGDARACSAMISEWAMIVLRLLGQLLARFIRLAFNIVFLVSLIPAGPIVLPRIILNFTLKLEFISFTLGDWLLFFKSFFDSVSLFSACRTWTYAASAIFAVVSVLLLYVFVQQNVLLYLLYAFDSRAIAEHRGWKRMIWRGAKVAIQTVVLYGLQVVLLGISKGLYQTLNTFHYGSCGGGDDGWQFQTLWVAVSVVCGIYFMDTLGGTGRLYHLVGCLTEGVEGDMDDDTVDRSSIRLRRLGAAFYLLFLGIFEILAMVLRTILMMLGVWPAFMLASFGVNQRTRLAFRFRNLPSNALGMSDRYLVTHDQIIWLIGRTHSLFWLFIPYASVLAKIADIMNEATPFVAPKLCHGMGPTAPEDRATAGSSGSGASAAGPDPNEFFFSDTLLVRAILYATNAGVVVSIFALVIDPEQDEPALFLLITPFIVFFLSFLNVLYTKLYQEGRFRERLKPTSSNPINYELSDTA